VECYSPLKSVLAPLQFLISTNRFSLQQLQFFALKQLVNIHKRLFLPVMLHIFTVDLELLVLIKNNLFSLFLVYSAELVVHITLNFKDW
jgi:hypothetical protein